MDVVVPAENGDEMHTRMVSEVLHPGLPLSEIEGAFPSCKGAVGGAVIANGPNCSPYPNGTAMFQVLSA